MMYVSNRGVLLRFALGGLDVSSPLFIFYSQFNDKIGGLQFIELLY